MTRTLAAAALVLAAGCARAPSPLAPAWQGSIGTPNRGVLVDGREPEATKGTLRWLRENDRHWALPRFARAIERAASNVARIDPGPALCVGDLSQRRGGGPMPPHLSHRSGVDADLLFYLTTLEGAPVDSPGFVHVEADGIAQDATTKKWFRLDVEREWLLVKALVSDPDARVQWIFVSDVVNALLVEWAMARGESTETVARALEVMHQPHPGGVHDDHIHVRTACSPEETAEGCEPTGPRRSWLAYDVPMAAGHDEDLARSLFEPLVLSE